MLVWTHPEEPVTFFLRILDFATNQKSYLYLNFAAIFEAECFALSLEIGVRYFRMVNIDVQTLWLK